MPTFKVQGQVYHQIDSLLPTADQDHKFLQIYFTGDKETEIDQRCAINNGIRRKIISSLRHIFHKHNHLVKLFKTRCLPVKNDGYPFI